MPDLLSFRTLMVGSAVGEGVLAAAPGDRRWCAAALARALPQAARRLGASFIVLKEFPSDDRGDLDVLLRHGYTRIASLPYVTLDLDFATFDEHLDSLSQKARYDFKRKARAAAKFPPLIMEVTGDISTRIDELYPLYVQVWERADLRFEKLSPEYFRRLGREMRDRARFLIWTQNGRAVGFQSCILHDGVLWIDVIGMDYSVALDLHLYFIMKRDALEWAALNGVRQYCGGPNNYDPKLRLGCRLKPIDLYASHVNPFLNEALRRAARWLSPARHEPLLQRFPNAQEL
jgi:predicted N-acyltransferase